MNDIAVFPGSKILAVAKLAFATEGVDFLCFGESDYPSPPSAHAAIAKALAAGDTRYPDVRGLPALRQGLAAYLDVDEARIQVTGSGMAAVSVVMAALMRPGDRLLHVTPAWPNSGNAARMRHAEVEEFPLTPLPDGGFRLDLARLAERLVGARALFLNSPSNPTGWTATRAELAAVLALCRTAGTWLIADEVYGRLVYDDALIDSQHADHQQAGRAPSVLDVAMPSDRVMVVGSFSKTWAMTGWRVGWVVVPDGARDPITELVEITHSGVAPFVQAGAVAALADTGFAADFQLYCAAGRALTQAALQGVPNVRYTSPPGAFYAFLGVDGLTDSIGFATRLVRERLVAVAPGGAFGAGGEGFLRLCFAQSPARLERALGRLVEGLSRI